MSRDTPSALDARTSAILAELRRLGGDAVASSEVARGDGFTIPRDVTLGESWRFLRSLEAEQEEQTAYARTYPFRPLDGAVVAYNALRETFGAVGQGATMSFFGPIPPALIDVPSGPNGETVQAPFGEFTVPALPDVTFDFGAGRDAEHGTIFRVSALGPKRLAAEVQGVFRVIADALAHHSIYRGQAIDGSETPGFLDLSSVDPASVIYKADVRTQLEANIWTPIRHAEACAELGVPLKRAILIHGPYGTGKTLAAYLTARIAVENGWTFLYARPGKDDLLEVLTTARLYQPAVVFFEDADVIADATREDADGITLLLDAFDGIAAKGTGIIAVLTTNHPEKIHKGMVRPGRLDAVIEIADLDAAGVEAMIRHAVPAAKLTDTLDMAKVGDAFAGFLPAFAREAIDRAVRYALTRANGDPSDVRLDADDFVAAADGLRPQLALMEAAPEHEGRTTLDGLTRRYIGEQVADVIGRTSLNGLPLMVGDEG